MALEYGEQQTIDLTTGAVLAAAVRRTGLDDFGDDQPGAAGFRERLGLWLGEIDDDPNRTGLGRLGIFGDVRALRVEPTPAARPAHSTSRDPRRGDRPADHRRRSAPLGHDAPPQPHGCRHPVPFAPALGELRAGADAERAGGPRRRRPAARACQAEWEQMLATVPLLAAMHPMTPDHIHEEIELQQPDFSSYNLEWVARVPGWRDYYLAHDQTPALRVHADGAARRSSGRTARTPARRLGAEVAAAPRAARAADERVPRRDHRDHPPRPGVGDPVGRHDARLRCAHELPRRRPRGRPRVLDRSNRADPRARASATAGWSPPTDASTCSSTSSWPTTSRRSSASTTSPACR